MCPQPASTMIPDGIMNVEQCVCAAGHWLESAHKMAIAGLLTPDSDQQAMMAQVIDIVVATTRELKALGALDNLDQIRAQNEQLYLDLVGDSAHAIRGLELATGRGGYRI